MLTLFRAPPSRSPRRIRRLEELGARQEMRSVELPRMDGSGAPDASDPHAGKKVSAASPRA